MFCTKCGKQLDNSAKFCSACGNPVSAQSITEAPAEAPVLAEPASEAPAEAPVLAEPAAEAPAEAPVLAEPVTEAPAEAPVLAESAAEAPAEAPVLAEPAAEAPAEAPVLAESAANPAENAPAPASFEEFAQETPAPRKKKKILPWIAGGTAVVLAGTAAVGYFGFRNQVMRLFMGDAGFALHVEKKTGGFVGFDERTGQKLNEVLAAQIDEMMLLKKAEADPDSITEGTETDPISVMVSELLALSERFGGSELAFGMSMELDGLLNDLLTRSELQNNDLSFDQLEKFRNILRVTHTDTADRFEFMTEYGGSGLCGADLIIDPEKLTVTLPELSDYTFFAEYTANDESPLACSAEEIGRICGTVAELYYQAYSDAEITYEDGSFTVAGQTVECTKIRASLSAGQMNALYQKINETLKNDEYLRDYYRSVTGEDMSGYDALFDDLDAFSAPFISESYIGRNATLLAKTYSIAMSEENDPFTFEYAGPDETDHFRIGMPDGKRIGIDTSKNADTEEDDGTIEFSYKSSSEENAPTLVLALDYVSRGTAEYLGEPITLGEYTLRFSEKDTFLRSMLTGSSPINQNMMSVTEETPSEAKIIADLLGKFTLNISVSAVEGEESAFRTDYKLAFGDYLSLSAYLEQRPVPAPELPITVPGTNGEKCINMREEPDTETLRLFQINLYEKLLALPDRNEELKKLDDSLGLSERIEAELNKLHEELEFEKHYRKYTSYTKGDAVRAARKLFDELEAQGMDAYTWNSILVLNEDASDYNNTWGKEEFERTVRLYFDENGKVTVLDDGKMGFLDYSELTQNSDRENLYVELLFSYFSENPLCGITAVYTDDPNDLPENLPTVYNYFDAVYEWNGEENAIGGFAVGTYPALLEGKNDAQERIRAAIEKIKARDEKIAVLNDSAKRLNDAVNGFLSANPDFFRPEYLTTSLTVRYDVNRGWIIEPLIGDEQSNVHCGVVLTDGKAALTRLTDHLNRRFPEFEPVTAQIHFVRGDSGNSGISNSENAPTSPGKITAVGTAAFISGTVLNQNGILPEGTIPDALDFWTGYCNWTENNPDALPQIGMYWTNWGEYTLVGTYCAETDAPLADWDQILHYGPAESDELNADAWLLSDTLIGLFGGTSIGTYDEDRDPPLFSLVISGRTNGGWLLNGAYMNNSLYENSAELIDDETLIKLMAYLNELAGLGYLPMSCDVKVELHFLHNEFVGAAVVSLDTEFDFSEYGVPGTWEFYEGEDLSFYPAVPFGSYCVNTGEPLRFTE